jgi:hypothetical protein
MSVIIMNAFGFESLDHLDESYMQGYVHLHDPVQSVKEVIMSIYFNYPQNRTVSVSDDRQSYVIYRGNGRWVKISNNTLMRRMIERAVDVLEYTTGMLFYVEDPEIMGMYMDMVARLLCEKLWN